MTLRDTARTRGRMFVVRRLFVSTAVLVGVLVGALVYAIRGEWALMALMLVMSLFAAMLWGITIDLIGKMPAPEVPGARDSA